MKKRIISVLLALTVIFSSTITAFADEAKTAPDTYYELDLPFTYADTGIENVLPATFMIPGDSSTVYFKAEDILLLLELNYFDFKYAQTNTQCAITNAHFAYAVIYEFNTNKVLVYAGGSLLEYEPPAPALFKDGVAWLPFEFTMNLFNVSYSFKKGQLAIESPGISQLMVLSSLSAIDNYAFDWITELGYSKYQTLLQHERASFIKAVTGVVNDGNQWSNLLTMSTIATDNGYARDIAALFTSPSATEMDFISNSIPYVACDTIVDAGDTLNENLSYEGFVGLIEEALKKPFFKNNKKLKSYLKSLKKNKKKTKSFISSLNKKISLVDEIGDVVFPVLDYISCYVSIYNKNDFAAKSLETYTNLSCSFPTDKALREYATAKSDNVVDSLGIYLENNFSELIMDAALSRVPIVSLIMFPANLIWSLFSKNISDSYIHSEHAVCYQNDAREHMKEYINVVFGEDVVRKDRIEVASHHAYAYLKFSSIAREYAGSAINSSPKIDKTVKKDMLSKMDEKNRKIGKLLTSLELGVDGYFPDEVSRNKKDWCTDEIIKNINQKGKSLNNITQTTPVQDEFQPIPGDGTITPDAAVSIVVDILGGKTSMVLTDYILKNFIGEENAYNVEALEKPLYIKEIQTYAYLVRMGINQSYDQNCVFVPVDGSAAWLGIDNGNNQYYCYLDVDLKNFSLTELMEAMEKLYVYEETDGLVIVDGN